MWINQPPVRSRAGTALLLLLPFLLLSDLLAQKRPESYFNGQMTVYALKAKGLTFKVFDLNVQQRGIHAVYFGQQARQQYKSWQRNTKAEVLCYFAVGFAQDWDQDTPLGLSAERGRILNRALDAEMDGLVRVSASGQVGASDIEHERIYGRYTLRDSRDRARYLAQVQQEQSSFFQTQLLYSSNGGVMMGEPKFGKRASRRFLAVCENRNGQVHHLVLDLVASAHLNDAAQKALRALQGRGFTVHYLLNQDTGSRNIMAAFEEGGKELYAAPVKLAEATQLLVYYRR